MPSYRSCYTTYADDLVAIAESEEELIKKLDRLKDGVQSKGVK